MSTSIIVVGANGRMGRTISQLVAAEPAFSLAGLVDSKEHVGKLAGSPCPVGDSLAAVLPQAPGAVTIDFTAPAVSLQSARTVAESGRALVIDVYKRQLLPSVMPARGATPMGTGMSIGQTVIFSI